MFQSYSARIAELAQKHPGRTAITFSASGAALTRVSWKTLDASLNRWAHGLAGLGMNERSVVIVALPNGLEHAYAAGAVWRLGGMVIAISAACPLAEREQFLKVASSAGQPVLVISLDEAWPEGTATLHPSAVSACKDESSLPDTTVQGGRTVATGGTTGRPKIIVDPNPWGWRGETPLDKAVGRRPGQRMLVVGPLYHGGPFMLLHWGLLSGDHVVLMDRFDAARALALIRELQIEWVFLVPTHMRRILEVPGLSPTDFASLEVLYHSAAPCPQDLKRRWLELLPPGRIIELYGANDGLGATIIRGDEWLAHPGSVGRAFGSQIEIRDDSGGRVPTGEVGQIYMRPQTLLHLGGVSEGEQQINPRALYSYLGAESVTTADGFESVGDMGWLDAEGYLYIADRRVDMIVSGGANVYPAEVEAVLAAHPAVEDVAVIGLQDPQWGRRVHAVLQVREAATNALVGDLHAFARTRLAPYKLPKSYEFVAQLMRNEAGKLQRQRMMAEREGGFSGAVYPAPARDQS